MADVRFDLSAPDLFGNDAAEDEDLEVFRAYAVDRPEVAVFTDPRRPICIVRAFKGEGKSALLRLVTTKLRQGDADVMLVEARGKELSPALQSTDTDVWVRAWKSSVLGLLASKIGEQIGMAWSDDAMSLVEEAERGGYRSRSFIASIFDRLKAPSSPVQLNDAKARNTEGLVRRWAEKEDALWLFVDDVDENFRNDPLHKAKVSSFFIAARELVLSVPQLRMRLAIRPNTWVTISFEDEALSKVNQYCVDLRWAAEDMREVLGARIRGYLTRARKGRRPVKASRTPDQLISMVFESPMPWGSRQVQASVPLTTLSRRRPRWLIELCREAAALASRAKRSVITRNDVFACLEPFGRRRIADTVAEFRPQCAEIEELISAFQGQSEEYATDELMKIIQRRILQGLHPRIHGVVGVAKSVDVASFLFQVGFLTARRQLPGNEYEHLSFVDAPDLLRTRTNRDGGVTWEIHPVFRQVLDLRDISGRPVRRPPSDKRGR